MHIVILLTNFEKATMRRVKGSTKDVPIPACIYTYNKYKNEMNLFDNHLSPSFTLFKEKSGTGCCYK